MTETNSIYAIVSSAIGSTLGLLGILAFLVGYSELRMSRGRVLLSQPAELVKNTSHPVIVNGRSYNWPTAPSVVICFDGCDISYIKAASAAGSIPEIDRILQQGFFSTALAVMPTFTNPNNVSIVCGAPPSVHGVSGNYYLDRATGKEVMMVDATPMRADTILGAFSLAGASVAAITAKDKLRKALGRNLRGIAFSAEKADQTDPTEHGIIDVPSMVGRNAPNQYSADLSLFVLDAGIKVLESRHPDLMYLSLSDYVQHTYAPGTAEANAFMAAVDQRIAALIELGAIVGVVADHGMNDMSLESGEPNVIFVEDLLTQEFGIGSARVICPIADPYVRHHGALGGYVRVHLPEGSSNYDSIFSFLRIVPGIDQVLTRDEACARFDLPRDREGDIALIASPGFALGSRAAEHDLSQLAGARLRSHGGLAEQVVPFLVSRRLTPSYAARARDAALRNYDIFDFVLNGVEI